MAKCTFLKTEIQSSRGFEPSQLINSGGRELTVRQVEEISALAAKHGFKLAGFRSFERAVTPEAIARIAANAGRRLDKGNSRSL